MRRATHGIYTGPIRQRPTAGHRFHGIVVGRAGRQEGGIERCLIVPARERGVTVPVRRSEREIGRIAVRVCGLDDVQLRLLGIGERTGDVLASRQSHRYAVGRRRERLGRGRAGEHARPTRQLPATRHRLRRTISAWSQEAGRERRVCVGPREVIATVPAACRRERERCRVGAGDSRLLDAQQSLLGVGIRTGDCVRAPQRDVGSLRRNIGC